MSRGNPLGLLYSMGDEFGLGDLAYNEARLRKNKKIDTGGGPKEACLLGTPLAY